MIEKYLEAHKVIAAESGNIREWMTKPFIYYGETVSTDGASMFVSPLLDIDQEEKTSELKKLILPDELLDFEIKVDDLRSLVERVEKVKETKTVGKDIKCGECCGEGTVEWEYGIWTKEFDCPKCNGEGFSSLSKQVPTGNMIPDDMALVQIIDNVFLLRRIQDLITVCDIMKCNPIVIGALKDQLLFKIDDCKMMIMGARFNEDSIITKL